MGPVRPGLNQMPMFARACEIVGADTWGGGGYRGRSPLYASALASASTATSRRW